MTVSAHARAFSTAADEGADVVGGRQARLRGGGRPRRLQVGVDDLGGDDDGDPLTLDGRLVRREGLCDVLPDAHDREFRLCPDGDRLLQAGDAAVLAVVVRLRHERDAGVLEGGHRGRRCVEDICLRLRRRARPLGERGFEVDHRQCGAGEELRHGRAEGCRRVVGQAITEIGSGREVDVAAERERHRLAVAGPVGIEPWVLLRRRVGRGGRRRRMTAVEPRMSPRRGRRRGRSPSASDEQAPATHTWRFRRTRRDACRPPVGSGGSGAQPERGPRGAWRSVP